MHPNHNAQMIADGTAELQPFIDDVLPEEERSMYIYSIMGKRNRTFVCDLKMVMV